MCKSGVEMLKFGPDPVSYFSEKTKLVWVHDNGKLLVKVESTDLAEFKEAERMLKQTIDNVHKQLNFSLSNSN